MKINLGSIDVNETDREAIGVHLGKTGAKVSREDVLGWAYAMLDAALTGLRAQVAAAAEQQDITLREPGS